MAGNPDNGGTGDSTISPVADDVKKGPSYGYPGLRTATDGGDIKPTKRTNGKFQP